MIRNGAEKVSGRRLALLPAVGFALLLGAGRPAARPAAASPWWDLEIRLSAEGGYRMADGEATADGGYRFTVSWTGMMERDGADFLLYHNRCDLVRWEAEERSTGPFGFTLLSTADFADRPAFDLNFLLQSGDLLVFNLAARGFEVPIASSPAKFFLMLPSSAENAQSVEGVDYNGKVVKGTNRIAIPADALLKGPVEKTFAWDWKNEDWRIERSRTINISHRHHAKLTLIVRPHREARLRPDPPAWPEGPGAQARGWNRS
jgi:hypothetical protein